MLFLNKHPKGLFILFFTEMWERFSFYGMKTLFIFYLTKYHFFKDEIAFEVLANYAGLVYALPMIGGAIADKYLGFKKSIIFGSVLLVLGHFGMAFEGHQAYIENGMVVRDNLAIQVFYLSLSLIILGVGFLKPNVSSIVGSLYEKGDNLRDAGFTIFYMGINVGSLAASIACAWIGEKYGWNYGFGLAGIGMVLGLITFLRGQKHLQGLGLPRNPEYLKERTKLGVNREWSIYLLSILGLSVIWFLVQNHSVVAGILISLGAVFLIFITWFMITQSSKEERSRLIVLTILIFFTVIFWALFEQSYSSMNLFTDRVVNRTLFGTELAAGIFTGLNPLFIILLAPLMAGLWVKLGTKKMEPSVPVKFAIGIIMAGVGFGALILGIKSIGDNGKVGLIYLILAYFFHTIGELCLSPIGLSAVTKLSVQKIVGTMMGAWFLATAASEYIAPVLSKMASVDTIAGQITNSDEAVNAYNGLFGYLLWAGIIAGVILLFLAPKLKKHMHGIN